MLHFLHRCYTFCTGVTLELHCSQQSESSNFFMCIINIFTVLCRASSFHWSILNNEIHLSGSRLYGMVLVYGMADSCLYNKQNNTWVLGDMEFIFSCSHSIYHSFAALTRSISMSTLEDKFHISERPCFIFYIYLITQY